jgi:hypothetical protein
MEVRLVINVDDTCLSTIDVLPKPGIKGLLDNGKIRSDILDQDVAKYAPVVQAYLGFNDRCITMGTQPLHPHFPKRPLPTVISNNGL